MSIVVGFGGTVTGIVFRNKIEEGESKARNIYLSVLGIFMFSLVYPFGSYISLAVGWFKFAVRWSLGGYLVALLALVLTYVLIARDMGFRKRRENKENRIS